MPHRLERIRELGGITYYNDSKATNYDASLVALQSLSGRWWCWLADAPTWRTRRLA